MRGQFSRFLVPSLISMSRSKDGFICQRDREIGKKFHSSPELDYGGGCDYVRRAQGPLWAQVQPWGWRRVGWLPGRKGGLCEAGPEGEGGFWPFSLSPPSGPNLPSGWGIVIPPHLADIGPVGEFRGPKTFILLTNILGLL